MKRKLTTLGIVILTLLIPFVINILTIIMECSLETAGVSIPFITHFVGLIVLCVVLWIIFKKTKEKYLADAYIAFICLIAALIGLFFFAVWTQVYPYFHRMTK